MTEKEHVFNDLPYDIITKIFSLLDEQDCLTCMAVCRLWYSTVPEFFHGVWSTLRLSNNVVPKENKRWDICIRSHCHSVLFDGFSDEEKLYEAMERLAQCSCDSLKDIEFSSCVTTWRKQDQFASVWSRLASLATTRVLFTNHSTGILPCASILNECPNIYEFRFEKDPDRIDDIPHGKFWTTPQNPIELTQLTHLYLGAWPSIAEQLETVLKASPNLKYLSFGDDHISEPCIIDLRKLTSWCPKLIYVEVYAGWLSQHRTSCIGRLNDAHISEGSVGLRCFNGSATSGYGPKEIGQYIINNAATLESIGLRKDRYHKVDWSHVLKSIHAPRLHTLICVELTCNSATIETMLSQCPSLESITLRSSKKGARLDLEKVLTCSKHLECVHLGFFRLHYYNPRHLFESMVAQGSKITDLTLLDVKISDELLYALPYFSTLKYLSLWFEGRSNYYTDNGLTKLAENMFNVSSINTLELWTVKSMPFSVFRSLVTSPKLKSLSIFTYHRNVPRFTGPDLVRLLNDEGARVERMAFMNLDLAEVDELVVEYLQKELQRHKATKNAAQDGNNMYDILIETI